MTPSTRQAGQTGARLGLHVAEPPTWPQRALRAASGALVGRKHRNHVVAYVRAVGGLHGEDWTGSVQLHAIEIDGKLLPGTILSAELSPFVHDEAEVYRVELAVGRFETRDIRAQVLTTDKARNIVKIHHGWRALAVKSWRWGRSTLGKRFPILAP